MSGVCSHRWRSRVGVLWALACVALPGSALAQDVGSGPDADRVRVTIDPTVVFDDPPAWVVGIRPGLGLDRGERFGVLGLTLGRAMANHGYLGLHTSARLDARPYLLTVFRGGVQFARRDFDFASGTSLGWYTSPESWGGSGESGLCSSLWAEARFRLSDHWSLVVGGEVEVLYEALGFRKSRALPQFTTGLAFRF